MLGIGYVAVRRIPYSCYTIQRNYILHRIEDNLSTINIDTSMKINSVFTSPSKGHTKIGRLFTLLIVKNNMKHTIQYNTH